MYAECGRYVEATYTASGASACRAFASDANSSDDRRPSAEIAGGAGESAARPGVPLAGSLEACLKSDALPEAILNVVAKTTVTTAVVVTATCIVAGAIIVRMVESAARGEREARGRVFATALARSFATPLSRGDHQTIQRQIDQIVENPENMPEVERIVVVDAGGRIAAHTDPTRFGELWGRPRAAITVVREVMQDRVHLLELEVPVESDVHFGTLHLAFRDGELRASARGASGTVILIFLALLLALVLALTTLLNRAVARPLLALSRAVKAYTGGESSLATRIDGPEEVRSLVVSFDDMARRLHLHHEELELKVRERTRELLDAYEQLREANLRLQELAVTDGLTGLANRRAFSERLSLELERARRFSRPLSLVLFDIDHFKRLNDRLGHLEGDAALCQIARVLSRGRRSSDLVARYGGEEFALLMPETPHSDALRVAERLRASVEQADLPDGCTVSAGVATFPEQSDDGRTLVSAADTALYDAKHQGRNRVCSAGHVGPAPVEESA